MKKKEIKPLKTRAEMAATFNISRHTLMRKIKKAGIQLSPGLLSYSDQQKIIEVIERQK